MSLQEAKIYLGEAYVFHPAYGRVKRPHHSSYARVDVLATCARVRSRQSFAGAVEQVRQRLRMVHGRVSA